MALTVTAAGTATSTTLNGSLAVTFTASANAGDLIVLIGASDNNGTSGARSMSVANLSDSVGNNYILRVNQLNDPGAAAAGCHLNMWTATCQFPTTATSTTVTVAFSPTTTSKSLILFVITAAAGSQPVYRTGAAGTNTVAGTSATVTTASVTNGEAVVGAMALESNEAITADTDTTNGSWSAATTALANSGTLATSMEGTAQSKVVNATAAQTYNTAWTTATDAAIGYIIVTELPKPVGTEVMTPSMTVMCRAGCW